MANGLTINQEKRIRELRKSGTNANAKASIYIQLATHVANYRRAQKLNGPGAADARRELIAEIDKCLEALDL